MKQAQALRGRNLPAIAGRDFDDTSNRAFPPPLGQGVPVHSERVGESPPRLRKSTVLRRKTVRRSGGSVAWRKRTKVQFTLNHYRRA